MVRRARVRKLKTHIEGLDEVVKLLEDMGDAAINVLDDAAKGGAEIVLAEAKRRVPVDTGRLRDSLILKKSKIKNAKVRGVYTVSKKRGVEYFAPVELGTSKMKARPFLRPAVDENKREIAKAINNEVLKAIGRIR